MDWHQTSAPKPQNRTENLYLKDVDMTLSLVSVFYFTDTIYYIGIFTLVLQAMKSMKSTSRGLTDIYTFWHNILILITIDNCIGSMIEFIIYKFD